MDASAYFFCNLGIMPDRLPSPPERVRAEIPKGASAGQWVGIGCLGVLGLGGLTVLLFFLPLSMSFPGIGLMFLLAMLLPRVFRDSYQWVELEARTIRAKHFLTRRCVEHSVDEIKEIITLVNVSKMPALSDLIAGGRVRGFEIRFQGAATPIRR